MASLDGQLCERMQCCHCWHCGERVGEASNPGPPRTLEAYWARGSSSSSAHCRLDSSDAVQCPPPSQLLLARP